MHFEPGEVYHVYNRGNEKQRIFFNRNNYLYFLKKIRAEWLPLCDILNFCLMPNHFHFLIVPNRAGCRNVIIKQKEMHMQEFSKTIGKTLSSYTQAINIERHRTGNLFQKKTKAKHIANNKLSFILPSDYLRTCFYYAHQNPVSAGMVEFPEEWEFSSARDYANLRNGTLCNKKLFFALSGMCEKDFIPGDIPVIRNELMNDSW